MKIYKSDVLRAVATEPLSHGLWESHDGCTVCVVGAVLRQQGVRNIMAMGNRICYNELAYAGCGKSVTWIGALSNVWESLREPSRLETDIEDDRAVMLEWVEDNVPDGVDLLHAPFVQPDEEDT